MSKILVIFFGLKYLKNSFDADAVPGIFFDPGFVMEKIRMWDKHPGSATSAYFCKIFNFNKVRTCVHEISYAPACLIAGRDVKHREDVRPTGLDIERLAVHNVRHTAHHHVAHCAALVVLHDVLEWAEEVLLEVEVGELALLDKLGRQLTERVHREERDFLHTHLSENFAWLSLATMLWIPIDLMQIRIRIQHIL